MQTKLRLESESKSSHDFQFPLFTESQMKEMEYGMINDLKSINENKVNDYENSSHQLKTEGKASEASNVIENIDNKTKTDKKTNNECNWMISTNQCNIKYSPFHKSAPWENKNELMKSVCHGLVDMFFGQKEEIGALKYEIQKLEKTILQSRLYSSPSSKKRSYSNDISIRKQKIREKNIKPIQYSIAKGTEIQFGHFTIDETKPCHHLSLDNSKRKKENKEKTQQEIVSNNTKMIKEEEVINLATGEDDEFDNMLTNLKQKKGSIPNQNNPFRKSITFIDEQVKTKKTSFDNMKNNQGVINSNVSFQSDFLCGGKQISYQPNDKTIKLLKQLELELDPEIIEDIGEPGPEMKDKKANISNNKTKNHKRNYIESNKDISHLPSPKLNKQKQFKHGFKLEKDTKDKGANQPKLPLLISSFDLKTIAQCGYICLCKGLNSKCSICNGTFIINSTNFHIGFYESHQYKDFKLNDHLIKQLILASGSASSSSLPSQNEKTNKILSFFRYQYRLLSWKEYILHFIQESTHYQNHFNKQSLCKIYSNLTKKYSTIIVETKRSFLMKVSEKDSSINVNMILLILDITYNDNNKNYTLELSDGFKSVYSVIEHNNPISSLIEKKSFYLGMKLNIGLAKISKITEDFEVYISIYYNSISLCKWNSKLGPVKGTRYLIKNLANVISNGGDISMINIVILKKYDYYITDFDTKESYSKTKYEKMIQDSLEEEYQNQSKKDLNKPKEKNMNINGNMNIRYNFRIVCVDALLYYDYLSSIPKYKQYSMNNINSNLMKKLQTRRCVIDFAIKSIPLFDELTSGNVYRLMLLNISKGNNKPLSYFNYSNSHSELRLKANDSIRLKKDKYPPDFQKDNKQYQDMIMRLSMGILKPNSDACDFFLKEHNAFDSMHNEEFSFLGCYLNKWVISQQKIKEEAKEICYLFFGTLKEVIVLIKISNMNYFEIESFKNLSNKKEYKIFQWDNIKFEQALYYNKEMNSLIPLRGVKDKTSIGNIVLCLETHYYSNYKSISMQNDKKTEWDKIINEETIVSITNCL